VSSAWCLRFLSGTLRGRTANLRSGDNLVGSHADADVLLPPGETVRDRHLAITVGDVAVAVRRVDDAQVHINGIAMSTLRRALVAGDIVSIGSIDVELDRQALRADSADQAPDSMFATDTVGLPPPAPLAPPSSRKVWWAALAVCGLGLATTAWALLSQGDSAMRAAADPAAVQRAVAGFPEVEIAASRDGTLGVRGFVESRERKLALHQALGPFSGRVAVHVHSADDLVEQARSYISEPGVSVRYAGGGRLVASGTADDQRVRERIKRLAEDLHPSVALSDKVDISTRSVEAAREQWTQWQSVLPARIVSITTDANGLRHIQLANGARYYEGSMLRSGAELQRITPDGLVVDQRNETP
jgi:type III secretion system YscD/HrpQ family protein